jgi:hypothetical protein
MATMKNLSVGRRIIGALLALLVLPSVAAAQQPRAYAGGAFNLVTQTQSGDVPLGGTAGGGSVVFGVQVSPRVAVEFEPSFSFGEPFSWEYSYRPTTSSIADVVASRSDSFYSFQVRTRVGILEPVVGVSYVHGRISRHATIAGATYFDDSRADHGLEAVGGLDAAVKVTPRFFFVPTFRLFARAQSASGDPLGDQTRTGPLTFRYGAGVRVIF